MVLKVGIIGAGIAGLSAAIGLRRAGHDVEIFEQSEFKNEVGAAITITPNGTLVLKHWGFDFERARPVESKQIRMMKLDDLTTLMEDSFNDMEEDYRNKFYHFHRVDLHNGLRELAEASESASSPGKPVKINLGLPVAKIDCVECNLTLGNGHLVKKDLLIVADGIKSKFLSSVTAQEEPLVSTGRSAFRTLIPFHDIMASPELEAIFKDKPPGFWVPFDLSQGLFVVTYPCRGNTVLNVALMCQTSEKRLDEDDWHSPTTVEDLVEMAKDAHPAVKLLLSKASEVKHYNINVRGPLSTLVQGKVVIMGDAAHPMTPTHAQGGVLALEEGAALEIFFGNVKSEEQVESQLKQYDGLLRPHCALVQWASNRGHVDEPALGEERMRMHYSGPMPGNGLPFSKQFRDFFYSYDIREEVGKHVDK